MLIRKYFLLFVILLAVIFAFAMQATIFQKPPTAVSATSPELSQGFKKYWYAGKAELSSYSLEQVRYGHTYSGEVVLVFLTEDFRTDKHVKLESDAKDKATSILKLNMITKFKTGIYDYSMMNSIFSPVDIKLFPHALKVASSVQEWCGHTYLQLNLHNRKYKVVGKSYFEQEVETEYEIDRTWLEDEIWTRLRINPDKLPEGEGEMVPSMFSCRLSHQSPKATKAETRLEAYTDSVFKGKNLKVYSINYPELKRKIRIVFEGDFPYQIAGWEETTLNPSVRQSLTTRAIRKKTILDEYWSHNKPENASLRDSLQL